MKAPLAVYVICSDDDTPVLGNALRSTWGLEMEPDIYVFHTGPSHLSRNSLEWTPYIYDVVNNNVLCLARASVIHSPFAGQIHFSDKLNEIGGKLSETHEWVLRIDSDEMLTNQLVAVINETFKNPNTMRDISQYSWNWLSLYPDEEHYGASLSGMLAHGRLYRPDRASWHNQYHEHMTVSGGRRTDWVDLYMLHFRQLFAKRCLRQTGFPPSAWSGFVESVKPLSELGRRVTWDRIEWPEEECHE